MLVQIEPIRQSFFDIAKFDRHVWREHTTVDIDAAWINIAETPNPNVLHDVVEVATSDEVG